MIVLIISLILILSYGCSSPFSSNNSPDVVYVDINNKSGKEDGSFNYPYTSIAKGVSSAKEGATIVVRPGTYREMEIRMKRNQRLRGSGAENTIIERWGHDLIILASGCEVSGFHIKSEWPGTLLGPAIAGYYVKDIRIINNKFYYIPGKSIYFENATGYILNNSIKGRIGIDLSEEVIIENNEMEGVPVPSPRPIYGTTYGAGISLVGASPIIRNNKISKFDVGIEITRAVGDIISMPLISSNTIESNNKYGIKNGVSITDKNEPDLGGGKRGSPGGNIIRNNGKYDLLNESPSEIYAQHNTWTHSTEEEIDKYDICDDDEGKGGKVIFVPFKKEGARNR